MNFSLLLFASKGYTFLMFSALLGIMWSVFLCIHKRGNRQANQFLAILVFVLSILILRGIADKEGSTFYQFVYLLSHGFIYLIGSSFYFYIKSKLGNRLLFKDVWKHYAVWGIAVLVMIGIHTIQDRITDYFDIVTLKIAAIFFIITQVTHLVIYLYISRRLVNQSKETVTNRSSSQTKLNYIWVKHLMIAGFVIGSLILILSILIITGGYYTINNTADFLFLFLLAIILLVIIYKSWKQPEVISGIYKEKDKYKNSKLTASEAQVLKSKLESLIQENIYLNPDLNLKELASHMDITTHELSQLINEVYDQNFFNFINGFRIEFAKQKIENGGIENLTIEALAYDSGFNSKTTFNRAFKKVMNCTPMEYYRSLNS
ncbi:helix-turn-helix domain-containing protein [Winogradskyella sp. 3972H.M.0a.05]|uniref:helix-turn-helix domain-containing protein n=1 Tax=Winogradskyella sp. 3972H.M.0a.05 TaxID=2950277 RepID=UPI00339B6D4E